MLSPRTSTVSLSSNHDGKVSWRSVTQLGQNQTSCPGWMDTITKILFYQDEILELAGIFLDRGKNANTS